MTSSVKKFLFESDSKTSHNIEKQSSIIEPKKTITSLDVMMIGVKSNFVARIKK